jgi:NAD(P)-dependent dehydrogenase (short-subunit alcohol dehydrogenase family)
LLDAHRWARAAMLQMREQRFGTVILIGPTAGLEPNDDRVAPSTLGGALRGLAESLAYAGLRFNVQTYAVRLGARPVDLGHTPETVWPELGPRLVELLGGRLDVPSGGLVDIGESVG